MPQFDYKLKSLNQVMVSGNRDHPDLGRISPNGRLYFHNIPKNASSFMCGQLDSFGWNKVILRHQIPENVKGSRGICLLRDPIKRWVSGITEFLSQIYTEEDIDQSIEFLFKLLYKNPDLDAHTAPQASYLTGFDLDWFDYLFIHEAKGVNASMVNYLRLRGWPKDFTNHERENTTLNNPFKMKIREIVNQKLKSNEEFKQSVKSYYTIDYELIEWATRNQKWIPSI